jgi:hypothetical protein
MRLRRIIPACALVFVVAGCSSSSGPSPSATVILSPLDKAPPPYKNPPWFSSLPGMPNLLTLTALCSNSNGDGNSFRNGGCISTFRLQNIGPSCAANIRGVVNLLGAAPGSNVTDSVVSSIDYTAPVTTLRANEIVTVSVGPWSASFPSDATVQIFWDSTGC